VVALVVVVVVVVAAMTPAKKQSNLTWTLDLMGASIPHSH
jgi:hypothetical protein